MMKIADVKDFGAAIRARRKQLNYTQAQLASFTGFSVSFLSDLENGKETAEIGKALFIAQTLGIDMELRERGQ